LHFNTIRFSFPKLQLCHGHETFLSLLVALAKEQYCRQYEVRPRNIDCFGFRGAASQVDALLDACHNAKRGPAAEQGSGAEISVTEGFCSMLILCLTLAPARLVDCFLERM